MNTTDKAYFCPSCFSPSVEVSVIAGGDASCSTCQWKGPSTDLLVHKFQHDLGSSEEVLRTLVQEFKKTMAANFAPAFVSFLHKWGFFSTDKPTPQELTRYIVAMSKATILSLFEVRKEIEKERARGGN